MELKQKWMGLVIIFCLIITIGASIGLQQVANDSKSFHELNTLVHEPLEVSKNVESPNSGTSLNYTWTSWANASDYDNDLEFDTLNVYYNFSNFNYTGIFAVEFDIDVFIDDNGSFTPLTGDWEEFYEEVEPNNSYIWSYEWRAIADGNYSIGIGQEVLVDNFVTSDYFMYYEEFYWADIHQFTFLHGYSVTYTLSDQDQDSFNDTLEIDYSLNFSYTGHLNLEIQIFIVIWDEDLLDWDFYSSDYEHDSIDVVNGDFYNWSYQFKAWIDGDYQIAVGIDEEFYNLPFLVQDIYEWNDADAFTLINEMNGVLSEFDKDGDSCPDSFQLEFYFNFTVTGEINLRIRLKFYFWENSSWNYFESEYSGLKTEVVAGEIEIWNYEWSTLEAGKFRVNVSITDYDTSYNVGEETLGDIDLCAYEIINDWKSSKEEIDLDQDGTTDTIKLNYELLFKSTGWIEIKLDVAVKTWEDGYYYTRHYHTYFEGNVNTSNYYHCYYEFSAKEIIEYSIQTTITTSEDFFVLDDEAVIWTPLDVFNPVSNISYSTSEADLDNDGLIDTIIIDFELTFSASGSVILVLEFDIQYYDIGIDDWRHENPMTQQFMDDVTAGEIYESTFQYTAPQTGDYIIDIAVAIDDYGSPHIFEDIIYWYGNVYTLFEDYYFTFTEIDSDFDGLNDSVAASFNFKVTGNQTLLLVFGIDAKYYDEGQDSWISTGDMSGTPTSIFLEEFVVDTWYSWNHTWGAPFNDTFNVSISLSGLYYPSEEIIGYYLFENATKFDDFSFELEILPIEYDTNVDGFNETFELDLRFNFHKSGVAALNISFDVITVPNLYNSPDWNLTHLNYQYNADVTAGNWYNWFTNITVSENSLTLYLLTVFDRGVPVFYSTGILPDIRIYDPYEASLRLPLLPVIPPEPPINTTTTTTTPTTTTTTTTTVRITPGWYLAVSLLVITTIITSRRIRVMKER